MKAFRLVEPNSLAQASELLRASPRSAHVIAGGTDLMGELKEGVVLPDTLVSLARVAGLATIAETSDGLRIGALCTLADIEADPRVAASYPALAQAVGSIATPQIRNVGTLGGNLCQRPRCWYYRSPLFDCRKKGGGICFAVNGSSKYHAILGARDCYIVHPSDAALALIAYGAEADISRPEGARRIPVEDLFVGPERNILAETVLEPGEIVTHVLVPTPPSSRRSVFLKFREREAQDFALVSVAASLDVEAGRIERARIVLGGVAPVPLRARGAELELEGSAVSTADARRAGEAAVEGARPLKDNHFKVALTSALVRRAVTSLLAG